MPTTKDCDEAPNTNDTNFNTSREFCTATMGPAWYDRELEKAQEFFSKLGSDQNTTTPDQNFRKMRPQTPKHRAPQCKELAAVEREKAELDAKLAVMQQENAELAAVLEQQKAELTAKLAAVQQENTEMTARLAEAAAHIGPSPPSGGDSFTVYAISIEPTETIELTVRPGDNIHWAVSAGFDIRASDVERVLLGDHEEAPEGATFAEMGIEEDASLTVAYRTDNDLPRLRAMLQQAQNITRGVHPLAGDEVQDLDYGKYTRVHIKRKALANSSIAEGLQRLLASV